MKLLLIISLFFSAGSLPMQIKQFVNKPVITDQRADALMNKIYAAYEVLGQKGVDGILDSEPVWYGGINLYIDQYPGVALEMMMRDKEAIYHIANKVAIETVETEDFTIIIVVSY